MFQIFGLIIVKKINFNKQNQKNGLLFFHNFSSNIIRTLFLYYFAYIFVTLDLVICQLYKLKQNFSINIHLKSILILFNWVKIIIQIMLL